MTGKPIEAWMFTISGFTEGLGEHSGTISLWRKLRRYSSEVVCVQTPRVWDDRWDEIAAMVDRESAPDVRILVCAYSWGAGHGFIKLARALHRLGRRIETAVLCDPVYRSYTIFGRWLVLVPGLKIRVPANVDDVFWLRQDGNRPRAHEPVTEMRYSETPGDPLEAITEIHAGIYVPGTVHCTIDDSVSYHGLALKEARRITSEPPRNEQLGPILHN